MNSLSKPVPEAQARRRIRRSAQQWESLVQAQSRSGLSVSAYCAEQGLSVASLLGWRRRFRTQGMSESGVAADLAPAPFIELRPAQGTLSMQVKLRLELGDGLVLELTRP